MNADLDGSPSAVLETVLSYGTADHLEVTLDDEREASTRFANNAITQNVARRKLTVSVKAAFGQCVGRASVTELGEEALRACVARAEEIARASAPDPEFLPPPGPQQYLDVRGSDERVAAAGPEERAAVVRRAIVQAEVAGQQSAGSFATNSYRTSIANTAGLFYDQSLTDAQFVMTAMTGDSSGWARSTGFRWDLVDADAAALRAVEKAESGRQPRDLPAGRYTVILEPAAVDGFFSMMLWSMDAKKAAEGCTAFTGREGQRVGAECIQLSSRPDHPELPVRAAAEDALARPEVRWIEDGVLKTLVYNRFWAEHTGRPFTGAPGNFIIGGGDAGIEDLIAGVEHGLLVTRFWYIRFVDPMKLLLTGMTRDGLYRIVDGQVLHGLKNVRFNESPLRALEQVTALGRQERFTGRHGAALVPAMRVENFQFSSGTSF